MADFRTARILVTGASGTLGTRVPDALAARGAQHVNASGRALRHGFEANRPAFTG